MAGAHRRRRRGGARVPRAGFAGTHLALPFKACRKTSLMARSMLVLSFAEVAYLRPETQKHAKISSREGERGAGTGAPWGREGSGF